MTSGVNGLPVRYRAHCPTCRETGREFTRFTNAEEAARGHMALKHHETYVIDQYGLRVVGSTQKPVAPTDQG